jgi:hypothetical protein
VHVEVTKKRKEVLGEGHPEMLTSMSNLASTLRARSRHQCVLDPINSCARMSLVVLSVDQPHARSYPKGSRGEH